MTLAALRRLLDEIDTEGGPEAARRGRPTTTDHHHQEGPQTMAQPAPQLPTIDPPLKAVSTEPKPIPVGQLLAWGDQHTDPDVRDQAARARAALVGLRRRHEADAELTAITTEAEQLEQRLAELRQREAELTPTKAKKKRTAPARDYDTRTVRAWAAANGIECARIGQIPKRVLDAWRAAQEPPTTA
ncbi:Lsr2 family DNA-binding protein [Streptomyces werraensis]|uniref:Lsr2 family DNA-binding protein n=1 Tax=Streptomyces werraensis TaxID=68284 RepID=UPI0036BA97C2